VNTSLLALFTFLNMFSRSRSFVRKFCHHSSSSSSSLTPYSTSSFSPSLIWRSKTSASSSTPGYLVLTPFILLFYAKQHTSASDNDGLPSPSIPKFILTSSSPEQILSKEQFKTILQKNISSLKAFSSRNIQVKIRFHGKIGSAGGESECHVVELTNIDPSSILELISTVSQILSPGTIELHSIGNDSHGGQILSFVSSTGDRSLSISGNNDSNCVLSIFKDGGYSLNDVDTITKAYQIASSTGTSTFRDKIPSPSRQTPETSQQITKKRSKEEAISKLQSMGINIYTAVDPSVSEAPPLTWESLAGYQHVKREIKNTILTPLLHPEVYDNITKFTRESFESNRPKAVLLEGPPGTGKTLTARIIAQESSKPMVHLPLEVISSKWYGESEKRIAEVLTIADLTSLLS
jgi:SpoVK/Ycf46/Vps4 family AAA+-type ATPase